MHIYKARIISLLIVTISLIVSGYCSDLTATAVTQEKSVFIGESFVFQIQVEGSENPQKPDLSHITDFSITYQGGQQNSSRSVRIINGKMEQQIYEGYFFSYYFTPKSQGFLTIPPITVFANAKKTQTKAVQIQVKEPVKTDDFKLRLEMSKETAYVGEPVICTVTFYISKSLKNLSFNIPLLEQTEKFYFANPEVNTKNGSNYYKIPIGNEEVIAKEGTGYQNGKQFSTISFQKILIPKKSGKVKIKPATASSAVLVGYKKSRRRSNSFFNDDIFSDFFNDSVFSGRRGQYKKIVVPSNSINFTVKEIPLLNQPKNFMGHIGEYKIDTKATPHEVSVGDPITLQIVLSGPEYLEHIKLPPLNQQPDIIKNFKIPKDISAGEISGNSKLFTQTIRALNSNVSEIPSIKLIYFDSNSGQYKTTQSQPIPIKVKEAKVITALDAEGLSITPSTKKHLETWTQGIAYNYNDQGILKKHYHGISSSFQSPLLITLMTIPPFIYIILLLWTKFLSSYKSNPSLVRSKKAYSTLKKSLNKASQIQNNDQQVLVIILEAVQNYLADKLRIPGGALTFKDVESLLKNKHLDPETLSILQNIFNQCEQGRYAGNAGIKETKTLLQQALNISKIMEKKLK